MIIYNRDVDFTILVSDIGNPLIISMSFRFITHSAKFV